MTIHLPFPNACYSAAPGPSRGTQAGLSIIELMIGMAIGLIITAAIGMIYVNNRQTLAAQEGSARVQETGRFVHDVIGRSLRQAGNIYVTAGQNKNYCNCVPVTGADGASGAADTLIVRYETGEDEVSSGNWGGRDCTGGFANAGTLVTNTFSLVGTNLQCVGSVGGTQPLAAEIEDLQVVYGVDINGNRAVDRQVTTPVDFLPTPKGTVLPPNPANNIVTARVCVLVRSPAAGVTSSSGKYTNCAGVAVANPDTRLRRAFTATYTLRNTVIDLP